MKKTITKQEYWQLEGLLALGRQYRKSVEDCQTALAEITGEDNADFGALSGDFIWEDGTVKQLLKVLKIQVQNGTSKLHN